MAAGTQGWWPSGVFPAFHIPALGTPTRGSGTARSSGCARPRPARPFQKLLPMEARSNSSTSTTSKDGGSRSRDIITLFPRHQAPAATTALFSLLPSRGKVSRRAGMLISPDTRLPQECHLTWILCPAVLGPEPGSILRKRHTIQQNRALSSPG